jgi:hypothetical protein
MMPAVEQLRRFAELPPNKRFAVQTISWSFAAMDEAEEAIAAARAKGRLPAPILDGLFRAFMPPTALRCFPPQTLYRAHIRELVARAEALCPLPATDWELVPALRTAFCGRSSATDAELLGVLSCMSLKAPLTADFGAAADLLFDRVWASLGLEREPTPAYHWPNLGWLELRDALSEVALAVRYPS